jgi:hypothetical protein
MDLELMECTRRSLAASRVAVSIFLRSRDDISGYGLGFLSFRTNFGIRYHWKLCNEDLFHSFEISTCSCGP